MKLNGFAEHTLAGDAKQQRIFLVKFCEAQNLERRAPKAWR